MIPEQNRDPFGEFSAPVGAQLRNSILAEESESDRGCLGKKRACPMTIKVVRISSSARFVYWCRSSTNQDCGPELLGD
jgi:hypothetical protein